MADLITVRFVCLHPRVTLASVADLSSVQCGVCGERQVQSVVAPPPRFTAVNCQHADMGPRVHHA